MTPRVTIGFLPRERYVVAAESLESLYANTTMPFDLVIADPATPPRYLDEMLSVLDGHDNWRMVHADRPLVPAATRNLLLESIESEFVCFLENDNLFTPGWLESLLAACEEFPADVAAPLIREGRGEEGHFDRHLGSLVASETEEGKWEVKPLDQPRDQTAITTRVQFVEQHCLLFRRSVFDRIGPYDDELNTRDEVDLSLALHFADVPVVLEPRAIINYVPPTSPPEEDELPFYNIRWDLERAASSRDRIRDRWSLVDTPGDLEFVRYRNRIPQLPLVRRRVDALCAAGGTVVVLDDGDWFDTEVLNGSAATPFPDASGHFGGFPASDAEALEEFERVTSEGATHIVVGWPAQWWFDYLPRLREALEEWSTATERDDLLEIFSRAP
jgi:GT2 family glycosyltransferase